MKKTKFLLMFLLLFSLSCNDDEISKKDDVILLEDVIKETKLSLIFNSKNRKEIEKMILNNPEKYDFFQEKFSEKSKKTHLQNNFLIFKRNTLGIKETLMINKNNLNNKKLDYYRNKSSSFYVLESYNTICSGILVSNNALDGDPLIDDECNEVVGAGLNTSHVDALFASGEQAEFGNYYYADYMSFISTPSSDQFFQLLLNLEPTDCFREGI